MFHDWITWKVFGSVSVISEPICSFLSSRYFRAHGEYIAYAGLWRRFLFRHVHGTTYCTGVVGPVYKLPPPLRAFFVLLKVVRVVSETLQKIQAEFYIGHVRYYLGPPFYISPKIILLLYIVYAHFSSMLDVLHLCMYSLYVLLYSYYMKIEPFLRSSERMPAE